MFKNKLCLLDSCFPSRTSPISVVFNNCSSSSGLSPREVDVVLRKLRGGKAPIIDIIDYAIWEALYNSFPNFSFFKDTKTKFLLKPGHGL
ncbi:hypothetical protein TNCV_2716391 [Trichonephila clavipes]|nr:hypothetical protein TNCV_2716391 [Trichonephila clavipes]